MTALLWTTSKEVSKVLWPVENLLEYEKFYQHIDFFKYTKSSLWLIFHWIVFVCFFFLFPNEISLFHFIPIKISLFYKKYQNWVFKFSMKFNNYLILPCFSETVSLIRLNFYTFIQGDYFEECFIVHFYFDNYHISFDVFNKSYI